MGMPIKFRRQGSFGTLLFYKTADEIREAADKRLAEIDEKIAEREDRIKQMCEEASLDDAVELVKNIHEFVNTDDLVTESFVREGELPPIKAGTKSALLQEAEQIRIAKDVQNELRMVRAHLSDVVYVEHEGKYHPQVAHYSLSFRELEYFGFEV